MIQLTFKYVCDACNKSEEVQSDVFLGMTMPQPSLPPGWFYAAYGTYCPDHQVRVEARVSKGGFAVVEMGGL